MAIKTKFKLTSLTRRLTLAGWTEPAPKEMVIVKLFPVHEEAESLSSFNASATSCLEIGTQNLAAAAEFELGAEYYVTFERADG